MYNTNMPQFLLTVVIPSYNEMGNLQKGILNKIQRYLDRQPYNYEVIVVDDGSTDDSRDFIKKFTKEEKQFHLIENSHSGKAGAVTAGMLAAKGDYILFTDMDQATPIEELEKVTDKDEHGFPVNMPERLEILRDVCEYINTQIDNLFGAGASEKAFNGALELDLYTQFFDGMTPFIQEARKEKIAKYTTPASAKRNKRK